MQRRIELLLLKGESVLMFDVGTKSSKRPKSKPKSIKACSKLSSGTKVCVNPLKDIKPKVINRNTEILLP
ncbi:MAG: hypothetical protein ACO3VF_01040 [Tamlana sp.]|jgi:hypothetical protein